MEYKGRSGLSQSKSFNLSAWLSHFWMWTEVDEEDKKRRRRGKDNARLVEVKAEVQGRGNCLHWGFSLRLFIYSSTFLCLQLGFIYSFVTDAIIIVFLVSNIE